MLFRFNSPGGKNWSLRVLGGGSMLLGRDRDWCDLHILDDQLSRLHCEISARGAWGWIEDLDSRNGIFVNGQRVQCSPLSPGDAIRMGNCHVTVE